MVKCIEEYVQKDEPHYIIDAVNWIIGVGERYISVYTLFQYNWQVREE